MGDKNSSFRTSKDLSFMRRARRLGDDDVDSRNLPAVTLKSAPHYYSLDLDAVSPILVSFHLA